MFEDQSCITCEHMDDPDSPHKWHRCMVKVITPACMEPCAMKSINTEDPFMCCALWEARRGVNVQR